MPVLRTPFREDFEFDLGWLSVGSFDGITQCPFPVGLLAEPQRTKEWDFGAAVWGFALDGAGPQVGDGGGPVGVFRIEVG